MLDNLNTGDPGDRIMARQAVAKVIDGLGSTEKLALYVLDRSGLRVVCEFGTDRDLLMKRVAALNGHAAPYLQPVSQVSDTDSPGQDSGSEQDQFLYPVNAPEAVLGLPEGFLADSTIRTGFQALGAIADHLAGVPPRKALIWVSYGVPQMIKMPPMAARTFPNAMPQIQTYGEQADRAVRKLTNADVAVYGVDAAGVWGTIGSPGATTLDEFASRTGSASWHGNGLDFEMQTALNDVDHSYTLGYYAPPDYGDAKFHRIKVEVKRPGVKLRYREGYAMDAPNNSAADRRAKVVQALLSPVDNSAVPITVKAVRNQNGLSLRLTLDLAGLGLAHNGGRWQGKIEIVARFAAEDGTESGSPSAKTIEFNLTQRTYDAALREGLTFTRLLALPPRASKLRVLVRNDGSGEVGTLSIPLRSVNYD